MDYGNRQFPVRSGDVLAVGEGSQFPAEKKDDPLRRLASIILIRRDLNENAAAIDVVLGDAKIEVLLSPENYQAYELLKHGPGYQQILNAAIVAPALAAVLEQLRSAAADTQEEWEDRGWFRVLRRKLKERGIDAAAPDTFPDSTLGLAHALLGEPLTGGLRSLCLLNESED